MSSPIASLCYAEITKQLIQQRGFNAVGAEAGMLLASAASESLFKTPTELHIICVRQPVVQFFHILLIALAYDACCCNLTPPMYHVLAL